MRLHLIVLFAALTACTGTPAPADAPPAEPATEGAAGGDAAGGPEEAATTEAAPEVDAAPGEGSALPGMAKLTEVQGKVHAMMAKADATKTLTEALGEPASSTDTEMTWIAQDGDSCKVLKVQLMGDMTGGVSVEDADCPSGE